MNPLNPILRALAGAVLLALLTGAGPDAATQPAARPKPNILLIVADDLGYADVGFHGCTDIPTPNIDALARAGVRFTNAYVSASVCAPSRAGLITGRYQQRFGFEFNPGREDMAEMHTLTWPDVTMPGRLKAAGYTTALVGKWHIGPLPRFGPQKRGFDEFFGFFAKSRPSSPDEPATIWRGRKRIEEREYITVALAREAVDFIDRHRHDPFFLELAFNAPHANVEAPPDLLSKFQSIENPRRRHYAAVVSAMDQAIGQVLEKLRRDGLDQNTLIVFLSDNGGPTVHNSSINGSRNTPLRGSKEQLFEGGIRVPMVMVWPDHLSTGTSCENPVMQLDLMPTFLAAAGAQVDPQWKLDGTNLLPSLDGTNLDPPHEILYWRFGEARAVRRGEWKMIASKGQQQPELYNLQTDISESHDVSQVNKDIVEQLEAAWTHWNSELQPPAWPQKDE